MGVARVVRGLVLGDIVEAVLHLMEPNSNELETASGVAKLARTLTSRVQYARGLHLASPPPMGAFSNWSIQALSKPCHLVLPLIMQSVLRVLRPRWKGSTLQTLSYWEEAQATSKAS